MDTKLHTAVRYGNVTAVLEALKDNLNPNEIGLFKWSPVHEAANNGERDILKLLICYKGDVNLQDKLHGNTPLHYAAREDNSACVTVLLKAGARIDITNYEGMTCLDEATSLCKEIIQEFVNNRNSGSDWQGGKNDHIQNRNMSINGIRIENEKDHIPRIPENAAIGQLHLSFEYHKTSLKIRVWQVSDLLLPPPQISMIDSIFVKSYLIPDTVKKTNRQTEAVQVEAQSKDSTLPPQNGIQYIFSPSSFRFETPLLYNGVTQNIISERSVQLEVYMTQKFTHKAFLMAMVHLPLRTAVRHPIREKYPLIPCMNYTIPNNMRVYSARDIIFDKSELFLDRSPSRSNSLQSGFSSTLAAKDTYPEDVEVENFIRRASLELSDSDCDNDVGSSIDIKSSLGKSRTSSVATGDFVSLSTDNEDTIGIREVLGFQTTVPQSLATGMDNEENPKPKKKIIPNELSDKNNGSENNLAVIDYGDNNQDLVIQKKDSCNSRNLLKIPAQLNDVFLDVKSDGTKEKDKDILQDPPNVKKKIIPPELLDTKELEKPAADINHSNQIDAVYESSESICLYDDISRDNKNTSHNHVSDITHPVLGEICLAEERREDGHRQHKQSESMDDQEYGITSQVNQPLQSSSLGTSDTGSSSTPVSRPETPIWDFYDFTLEESDQPAEHSSETEASSSNDDASAALGTLQESILRLTLASKTLDTCRVIGPVLPAALIEDLEMDDVDDIDDNNVDDGNVDDGNVDDDTDDES